MSTTSVAPKRDFFGLPLPKRAAWVVMLGSLTAIGAFTIDLYLPAFPVLERELGASAGAVQLTLTGTMIGVALGQLVVGPLADALGRRRPLLAGLCLHLVASLLCAVAPSVEVLGALRVLQGLGTAASSVIALAIVRDCFAGRGAARLIARLMLIIGASPIFAPSIGSALLEITDWRGIFVALALMSLALGVVVTLVLPETLPPERRSRVGLRASGAAYAGLLRDRAMLGLVAVAGLMMAALFGYVSGSSFVFQEQYGLSSLDYGLVFAAGGVAIIGGTQTNGSLVQRYSSEGLLATALCAGAVFAALLLLTSGTGLLGLWGVLVPLWATMFCIGLAQPNGPVLALDRHGEAAGTAAALLGAVQFGTGAAAAPLTSLVGLPPTAGMGVVMVTGLVLALVVFGTVVRPALRTPPPAVSVEAAARTTRAAEAAR